MNYFEHVLPASGRCVRLREYETGDMLAIGKRLSRQAAPDAPTPEDRSREILLTILVAYTAPRTFKFLPLLDKDGKPVLDEKGQLKASRVVDIDGMLDAIDAEVAAGQSPWITATYQSLIAPGEGQLEALFRSPRDFLRLEMLAGEAAGMGGDGPTVSGKARMTTG